MSERRPIEDKTCMQGMVERADLMIGAYQEDVLVGIARSVTDFSYCCYLSELAVDIEFQGLGIGKRLVGETKQVLPDTCNLILLSAPKAAPFYPKIGFTKHESAWWLLGPERLK